MRGIISVVIFLGIVFGIYHYHQPIKNYIGQNISKISTTVPEIEKITEITNKIQNNLQPEEFEIIGACSKPITYSIANLDSRFKISEEYFIKALKEAESIWENSTNKNLFEINKKNPEIQINLIYDYRQETTDKLKEIGITLDQNKSTYEEVKLRYSQLRSQYTSSKVNYDTQVFGFNARNKIYQSQVLYWNSVGGAPQKEYDELTKEKQYLENEIKKIQIIQNDLNQLVIQVNSMGQTLNKLAEMVNTDVRNYNNIGQTLGDSYEEGLYSQYGQERKIDIYEIQSYEQLVRVLMHEFGHALGIPHLDDKNAIMYYLNTSKELTLTKSDIDALGLACGLNHLN